MARIYGTIENLEVVRDATTGWLSLRGAGHQPKFAAMSSSASAAVRSLLTEPRYFSHRPTRPRFFVGEVRYRFTREAHTVDVHVNRSTRAVEVHVGGEVVGRGVLGDHRKIDWVLDAAELWQRPKVATCNVGETDPTVGTLLLRQLERDSGLASRIDEPAGQTRLVE